MKIQAYTFVSFPVGTAIELYNDGRPRVGTEFDVRHIDTKKKVQRAKVTKVEDANWGVPQWHILAEIIKTY